MAYRCTRPNTHSRAQVVLEVIQYEPSTCQLGWKRLTMFVCASHWIRFTVRFAKTGHVGGMATFSEDHKSTNTYYTPASCRFSAVNFV